MIRYTHTSMVARDVERLADFYTEVFGCVRLSPPQDMAGEALSRGSGIANAEVRGLWLRLPGYEENAPILELLQYAETEARPVPRVNEPGYSHISFDVSDISATVEVVLAAGGSRLGEIADMDDENGVVTFVYLRDPEGNIVELMRARDNTGADLTYQEQF